MASENDLNVSEAGSYKAHTQGPPSDTSAFHNDTPAPGERRVFDDKVPPPTLRPSMSNESSLPRIPVRKVQEDEIKESMDDNLTVPVVATGAVILLFAMMAGALAIGLMLLKGEEPEPEPEPVVEEVEGIPVRKDLRKTP
jgi:hypothetical protein